MQLLRELIYNTKGVGPGSSKPTNEGHLQRRLNCDVLRAIRGTNPSAINLAQGAAQQPPSARAIRSFLAHVRGGLVSSLPFLNYHIIAKYVLKIIWMKWMLVNVSVAERVDKEGKRMLVVSMPSNQYLSLPWRGRTDWRIMTPDDAKMVLELVKASDSPSRAPLVADYDVVEAAPFCR